MLKNKLIVSNWKMNLDFIDTKSLLSKLIKISKKKNQNVINVVCPQNLLIPIANKLLKSSNLILGAQDCHEKESGAYTGNSSIVLLKNLNCKYIIIGHSERRLYNKEENKLIKKKVEIVNRHKLTPILCVGEELEIRKKSDYKNFIIDQLKKCIPKECEKIVVAYEPIWAIGSGLTPSINDIREIHEITVNLLLKKIKSVKFLYGGSVNSKNSKNIISESQIDGLLIGGASIKSEEITKILCQINFD